MEDHPGPDNGGMDPEMMQAWMAYATPGEGQARLAARVGQWDVVVRHRMAAGAPMQEARSEAEFEMMLGGRFLVQEYEANWEGMQFEGIGIAAHNNKTGKYQVTWLDNMGIGLMQGSGEFKGDMLQWTAVATDPLMGDVTMRGTETFDDPNRFVATMYYPGPDGKEFKMMEMVYSRCSDGDHDHDHDEHSHHDHQAGEHPHGDHPGHDHPH
ncbi:MAG: DUF1579 family protein [Phycisphaerales bacterium]|jgi:hypothetical protein|nr:DUF1579 family protein [Phycisphaerales bacterium]